MYRIIAETGGVKTLAHGIRDDDPKCFSPRLKKAVSAFDTFEFSIAPDNPIYNSIESMRTLIDYSEPETGSPMDFRGRVRAVNDDMDSDGRALKTVSCESEMAYLCDTQVHDLKFPIGMVSATVMNLLIDAHNEAVKNVTGPSKTFERGEYWFTALREDVEIESASTWEAMSLILIEKMGGELRVRYEGGKRYLDFVQATGSMRSTEIKIGKNMRELSCVQDMSGVVTRIIPLGARMDTEYSVFEKRLTIVDPEKGGHEWVENEPLRRKYGAFYATVIFDDITDREELRKAGEEAAAALTDPVPSFSVTAIDLARAGYSGSECFELGSSYPINNWLLGINTRQRVVAIDYDPDERWNSALTFGSAMATLTGQTSRGGTSAAGSGAYTEAQINNLLAALGGLRLVPLTADAYSKTVPDPKTLYIVTNADGQTISIYLGALPLLGGGGSDGLRAAVPLTLPSVLFSMNVPNRFAFEQITNNDAKTSASLTLTVDMPGMLFAAAMFRGSELTIDGGDWQMIQGGTAVSSSGTTQTLVLWYKPVQAGRYTATVTQPESAKLGFKLIFAAGVSEVIATDNAVLGSLPYTVTPVKGKKRLYLLSNIYASSDTATAFPIDFEATAMTEQRFTAYYVAESSGEPQTIGYYSGTDDYNKNYPSSANIIALDLN